MLVRRSKITHSHIPKLFQFIVSNTMRRNSLEKLITKSETHFLIKIGDGFHLKSFFQRLTWKCLLQNKWKFLEMWDIKNVSTNEHFPLPDCTGPGLRNPLRVVFVSRLRFPDLRVLGYCSLDRCPVSQVEGLGSDALEFGFPYLSHWAFLTPVVWI